MLDDTKAPRVLHTGEGKVLVPLTLSELRRLIAGGLPGTALFKFEQALGLLELSDARETFKR